MTTTPRRAAGPVDVTASPQARWRTLPAGAVAIKGGIWAKRQAVNRASALPHGFRMLEQAGNFENLALAARDATQGYRGPVFMDSDVYKWIEAASLELARQPGADLEALIEQAIDVIEPAQKADGYLNSYYTVAEPGRRWIDFGHGHELYCAGHLFQAAVAHHRATGSARLLNVARRLADHIDATFGPGKRPATPGHPEIETALVELYRESGERRYLALAGFLLDNRGYGWLGPSHRYGVSAYFQDRVPIRESSEVEGHAVRALYLTAGVADVYLETGEQALLDALQRQFTDMVSRKLYITGGVGSRHLAEAFGKPYELPNELAYCETCAAIASIMWCWRMLLITGESRFADLAERTLYNAVLSGVSLDGELYFYVNPLADNGETENLHRGGPSRKPWHNVACCPPNVMRLVASLGHYAATRDEGGLQIHQYGAARIAADLATGGSATLRIESEYPWDGSVRLVAAELDFQRKRDFVAEGSEWPARRSKLFLLPPGVGTDQIVKGLDRDGNEVLDARELKVRKDLMQVLDVDGNQRVDRAEVARIVNVINAAGTDASPDDFLGRWDLDGNGAVDGDELPQSVRLRLKR